jgi:hypothetical protein
MPIPEVTERIEGATSSIEALKTICEGYDERIAFVSSPPDAETRL